MCRVEVRYVSQRLAQNWPADRLPRAPAAAKLAKCVHCYKPLRSVHSVLRLPDPLLRLVYAKKRTCGGPVCSKFCPRNNYHNWWDFMYSRLGC
jgi:hypothetical protein